MEFDWPGQLPEGPANPCMLKASEVLWRRAARFLGGRRERVEAH